MGRRESFYFPDDERSGSRHVSHSGCFVRPTTGFILILLAMILAVGVGLVVHFVERDHYKCSTDDGSQSGTHNAAASHQTGNNNQQTGTGSKTVIDATTKIPIPVVTNPVQTCATMAATNQGDICKLSLFLRLLSTFDLTKNILY